MFSYWAVVAGIVASLLTFNLATDTGSKRGASILLTIGLFTSVYCILAGLSMAGIWGDPFAEPGIPAALSRNWARRGSGLRLILLIRYWPFILVFAGGFMALIHGDELFATLRGRDSFLDSLAMRCL